MPHNFAQNVEHEPSVKTIASDEGRFPSYKNHGVHFPINHCRKLQLSLSQFKGSGQQQLKLQDALNKRKRPAIPPIA